MKKIENNKLDKRTTIAIIFLILFIIWTILIKLNITNILDEYTIYYMVEIRNESLTNIMTIITNIGGAYTIVLINILLLILIKDKKIPIKITLNLVSVFLISQIAKFAIHRARPIDTFLAEAIGYSYPSGHSMVSMGFYMYLCYLIYKRIDDKLLKIFIFLITLMIILLIGFSRLYLGVHYLTDVIGGYLFALAHLSLFIKYQDKLLRNKE